MLPVLLRDPYHPPSTSFPYRRSHRKLRCFFMGKRLAAWGLVLLLFAVSAQASERRYYFDDADSERGLASHSVNAIFQDHAGFHLDRHGKRPASVRRLRYQRFEHASSDPASLPDSVIMAITEDSHNRLWVGTNTHGIAAIDTATGKVVSTSLIGSTQSSRRDLVGSVMFDAGRGLWIGTSAGIEIMDTDSGKRREVFHFHGRRKRVRRRIRAGRRRNDVVCDDIGRAAFRAAQRFGASGRCAESSVGAVGDDRQRRHGLRRWQQRPVSHREAGRTRD